VPPAETETGLTVPTDVYIHVQTDYTVKLIAGQCSLRRCPEGDLHRPRDDWPLTCAISTRQSIPSMPSPGCDGIAGPGALTPPQTPHASLQL